MSKARDAAAEADLTACRAALRNGSRSFYCASWLLPKNVRGAATALYAFCREADDAVDESEAPHAALANLTDRLDRVYAGNPANTPVDRALAVTVARHDLPRALPEALLEGVSWDVNPRRYETIDDLHAYAARVAGVVGAMMTVLMGRRAPDTLARACDLGAAMQLTNIARDVGEDATRGRLYLPQAWMREAGLDPDSWLAAPVYDDRLAAVIARLLGEAEGLYVRAAGGIGRLPWRCQPAIHAASLIYAEIGAEVARAGHDSVSRRAVVPRGRKLMLLGRALWATLATPTVTVGPPIDACRFLVEAGRAPTGDRGFLPENPPWWHVEGQVSYVLDVFERLNAQDRSAREARRLQRGGAAMLESGDGQPS